MKPRAQVYNKMKAGVTVGRRMEASTACASSIVGEWGVQLGNHLHMLQGHPDDSGSCQGTK